MKFLGIQNPSSVAEKMASTVGGVISISVIAWISYVFTGYQGTLAILPSMGAAAVLLFAVPHGPLSQPWALFTGNLLSAVVGVTCAVMVDNLFLAGGLAVGLSIGLMHVCRCLHPPGGATALAAVIGGETLRDLGYWYVLAPTLINCLVIFMVALFFNNLFPWRRYPLSLMRYERDSYNPDTRKITAEHIRAAMNELDVVLDVSDDQVKRIVDKADEIMRSQATQAFDLELGAFYTNGLPGMAWSVRQVVDESPSDNPLHHMVIYRTVEGDHKHRSGSCTLEEFALWAKEKMRPAGEKH